MAAGDHDLHTLAGAYVMDAVSDSERVQFARHLASCAECREEIRELHEATARLGTASAVQPRSELKGPTIRAARRISQLPPAVPAAATAGPSRADRSRRSRLDSAGSRRARHWLAVLPRSALIASAILTASAVVLAVATQHMAVQLDRSQRQDHAQLDRSQRKDHMIATVLAASDAVMLTASVSTGGTATIVMSHREHALVFTAHGLRPLPAAECYELWLMGPSGDRPAGLLQASAGGMTGPAVVAGLSAGDMIGVTVEPAAGSQQPTSPPIVLIGPR
jgi:hypothetical protein